MLHYLKNIAFGFVISLIGSIPLGYLNIIGIQFYSAKSTIPVLKYLFGIVIIEAFVIYFTLIIATKLVSITKWKKWISFFTILFLLILSYSFYNTDNNTVSNTTHDLYGLRNFPFVAGLLLSSLNFAQIPFWFSWNLYVINQSYITIGKKLNLAYVFGALIGTFIGMLALIIGLTKIMIITNSKSDFQLQNYIWILFLLLALFQVFSMVMSKDNVILKKKI